MKIIENMLFQEPIKEIRKLAEFIGVSYTEELLHEIADRCSFEKLKNVEKQPYNFLNARQEILKRSGHDPNTKESPVYRKGMQNHKR